MTHNTKAELGDVRKQFVGYIYGFVLSLQFTLLAYVIATLRGGDGELVFAASVIAPMLGILAAGQFVVQLIYFLHLGAEQHPRWKQLVFWFMILIVFIIVVGSIWIMNNLNYNMMHAPAENMDVKTQRGF